MRARGEEAPPREFLPWSGFIVCDPDPLAMCFLLAYAHAPAGVVELMASRPGLSPAVARPALRHLWRFAEETGRDAIGLKVVACHTWSPGMEREARRMGFTLSRRNGSLLWKSI